MGGGGASPCGPPSLRRKVDNECGADEEEQRIRSHRHAPSSHSTLRHTPPIIIPLVFLLTIVMITTTPTTTASTAATSSSSPSSLSLSLSLLGHHCLSLS